MAAAALAVSVLYLNDYQKLKGTEKVIASLDKQETNQKTESPEAVTPVNAPGKEKEEEKETEPLQETSEMKVQEEEQKEIPKETTSDAEAEQKEETAASNHMSYTIQPGDTMTRISMKNYGTIKKIKEICELNQCQKMIPFIRDKKFYSLKNLCLYLPKIRNEEIYEYKRY